MSYDESRIQTLKDDMDGVLVFVCSCFVRLCNEKDHADMFAIGRFIFCCSHFFHNRQQREFEGQPSRSDGVLPPAECRNSFPDL